MSLIQFSITFGKFLLWMDRSNHPEWHQPANCILLHKHLELMFTRSEFMFTACVGAPRVMVSCPGMSLSSLTSAQPSTAPRMSSGSKTHIVSESRIYVYIIDVYSKILHGTQNRFLTFLFYTSQEH